MLKRFLNTDKEAETSGGNFAAIKADIISDKLLENQEVDDKKEEEKKDDTEPADKDLELLDDKKEEGDKKDDKKPAEKKETVKADDKKDDKKTEEKEEKEEEEQEAELSFEDKTDDTGEEKTWSQLAKDEGFEIEEDSYEAFKENLTKKEKEKYEAEIIQAREIGLNNALKGIKDPQARLIVQMASAGMSLNEILKPVEDIERAEKLSDIDLLREDLKLKKYSEEMIDNEIETLTENGKLKHEADKIRLDLKTIKAEINDGYSRYIAKHEDAIKSQEALERKQKADDMKKILDTSPKFMQSALPDKTRERVLDKYKAGGYDKLLSDPKFIANAILFHEFGEAAQKNLQNKKFQEGRETKTKDLHNIPIKKTGPGKKAEVKTKGEKKSNFSAIEDDMS